MLARDGLACSGRGLVLTPEARTGIARDAAADVAALLASGATVDGAPLRPGDVAVLVRTNDQGTVIRDALAAVGVPAVLSGTTSVFGTPAAREWLTLLHALEQLRPIRIRDAALTCFLGRSVAELCGAGGDDDAADALLDDLGATLRRWAAVLHGKGVAALLEAVTTGTGLPGRLLGVADGERRLTDVRHVGQALHAAAVDAHLGPAALVEWLRHRIDEAAADVGLERSRRLDSDAAAVQVITVHRSKGLEFPVVYVPFGWDRYVPREPDVPLLHDDGDARVLDVGGAGGPRWSEHCARHEAEEAGEDLRLLYVALTRARCQVVTWWVPATTTPTSPLHRLLFGRRGPGATPPASCPVPNDAAALTALRALAGADLAVEPVRDRSPVSFAPAAAPTAALAAATFTRTLDLAWRRTSYSALTAAAHGGPPAGVVAEPEVREKDDEGQAADEGADGPIVLDAVMTSGAAVADPGLAVPSPMADLPVGTGFGTLVHAVFESADLTAPDLRAELLRCVHAELDRHPTPTVDPDALAEALVPVARTPLGPLADDRCLADIAPRDRLAELDFELPLAGGDTPRRGRPARRPRPAAAPAPPRRRPPRGLPATGSPPWRGNRCGATSPAASTPSCAWPGPRFAVVDYKTNWLGPIGPDGPEPLVAAHYTPERLAAAMLDAHYPLQALLYAVALHRFLRWRLTGLRPAPAPRRGAVPVPARHVRAGRSGGRRRALRCLLLAAAGGAGDGAVGPARSGSPVTGRVLLDDPHDARVTRTATGVLAEFNAAGVLEPADVHVAGRIARLGGESADDVLLAVALAVRGVRLGSVCVELAAVRGTVLGAGDEPVDVSGLPWPEPAGWVAACAASPLVAAGADTPGGRPLRLVDGLLYLERYWRQEEVVRTELAARAGVPPAVDLDRLRAALARRFGDDGDPREDRQRLAAAVTALRPLTVLAGGPGTGKTTTVAKILVLLRDRPGPPPRIALAAPTGKAAARLQEAVRDAGVDDPPTALDPAPAAGLAARPQPVPPRSARPAALRRGRRRRDVDGVADDDGPAARRRPPGRPAGARRRPGPARVRRGGCRPRRPGAGPRPSRTAPRRRARGAGTARRDRQRGGHAGARVAVPRGGRRRSRGPCRPATRTRRSHCCAAEVTTCSSWRRTRPPHRRRYAPTSSTPGSRWPPRHGAATSRPPSPHWSGTACCAGTGAAPTA